MSAPLDEGEILARIRGIARQTGVDPQALLTRFGLERFLYRLALWERHQGFANPRSRDGFVLKGAWCFLAWNGEFHRPTKDVDLARRGDASEAGLVKLLAEMCGFEGADRVTFDPDSIRIGGHARAGGLPWHALSPPGPARNPDSPDREPRCRCR